MRKEISRVARGGRVEREPLLPALLCHAHNPPLPRPLVLLDFVVVVVDINEFLVRNAALFGVVLCCGVVWWWWWCGVSGAPYTVVRCCVVVVVVV